MDSGLSNYFHQSDGIRSRKRRGRVPGVAVAAFLAAVLLFLSFVPSVYAQKDSAKPTVESVNLKEADWVYSVYVTKDKQRYASVTRYDGDEIDIEIPAELGGVEVKEISHEAFYNNKYLTSAVLPDGVEKIGKYAFGGCIGLSRVTFPASLSAVGEGAFYGCHSLTEAVLPEGTLKIGGFAFCGCVHLQNAVFPASLKSIGDSAFQGCLMIEKLSFGKGLATVGDMAFSGCSSLRSVKMPGVGQLGFGAFVRCTSLQTADLGQNLTELRNDTFRGCESLETVTTGASLSVIGASALEGCTSLKALPQTEGLTKIEPLAFRNCGSLAKAGLGSEVASVGTGAFAGCTSLSEITVSTDNGSYSSDKGCLYTKDGKTLVLCPQGAQRTVKVSGAAEAIAPYAAAGCRLVAGIVLNEGLTHIGQGAFFGCPDITAVSVPDSVKQIGAAAFGMYLSDDAAAREDYLRMYASEGGAAEQYCTGREMTLIPYPETLLVSSERVVIAEGASFLLSCGFSSRRKAEVSWESSDESVVKVKKGKITAVSQGDAEIIVSAEGFTPRVIKVIVTEPASGKKSRERTYDRKLLYCGDSEELSSFFSMLIDPIFSANRFWFSFEPKVATVGDDGKVQAHSPGAAVITCRMPDGSEHIVTCTVTDKPSVFDVPSPAEELIVGETQALDVRMYPSHSKEEIRWKSDDESVAAVDEKGNITAVGQGKCTVTAVTSCGLRSSAEVKCVIPAETLTLSLAERDVYQGKEFNLTASVTPSHSRQKIRWRSSDPTVASVNSKGKVSGRSFGSATIYAETAGGLLAECRVNVITRAEGLRLDVKKLKINRGSVHQLHAIVRPSYSPETTDKCQWNSTNENVAVVDENGVFTAVGAGNCIINCRTGGNLISKCQVQVRLPAESVSIVTEKKSLYIGEVLSLEAVTEPQDCTDAVEWLIDSPDIARVTSGGNVKGRAMGTTVVTVRLTNDVTGEVVSDSVEITVLKKAESVRLSKSSLSLLAGENDFLSYTVRPDECNDTVRWYSTDETVASVREDGLITARSAGTCRVCIETGSGVTASCHITVN